jgi:hypothetical protein
MKMMIHSRTPDKPMHKRGTLVTPPGTAEIKGDDMKNYS